MSIHGRFSLVAALAALALWAWTAQANAYVYWANPTAHTIARANIDGSDADPSFIPNAGNVRAITTDDRYVYWAASSPGSLARANLDGSGVNMTFVTTPGLFQASDVVVNDQYVYWGTGGSAAIGRANIDGTGVNTGFIDAGGSVSVAIDDTYIYWTSFARNFIGRANLNGTGVNQNWLAVASPLGLAVDAGHVYWTNGSTGGIGRANIDGSGADPDFMPVGTSLIAFGLALDGKRLYWTRPGSNAIGRSRLDGTLANPFFLPASNLGQWAIAVDAGPGGTASAASLAFPGAQPVGTLGAPRTLTVTNSGHGDLDLGTARIVSGHSDDFLVSYDGCSGASLEAGQTCDMRVRFAPSAPGPRQTALVVTATSLRVPVSGTASVPPRPVTGATGPVGPRGATGPQGKTVVRVCVKKKVKKHGKRKRVTRRRCKTKVVTTAPR